MTQSISVLADGVAPATPVASPADPLGQALLLGGVACIVWSADHEISFATPALCELLGLASDDLNRDRFFSLVHPADRRRVANAQAELRTAGGNYEYQFRIVRPDGSVRWMLARGGAITDVDGRIKGFAGVKLDITAQKNAELAAVATDLELKRKAEQLWAILDTMPQIVWSALPDGFHDFYNQRWYEFTGVSPGTADGEGWGALFHPDDQHRAWTAWRHSLGTGEPYEVEYRLRRWDGTYHWTLGRALPIRNGSGEIERWFGTCTDIERLKTAEERLSLIAGELSHRIKSVFAIVGSLMSMAARTDAVAQPFVSRMQKRLVSLAIAHDYIGGALNMAPSLKVLLNDLVKPYQQEAARRVVVSGHDVAIGPGTAMALALIIHEFATNSVKYGALSANDGFVTVTCTVDQIFRVEWAEHGGPIVDGPPTQTGFGTGMADRVVKAQLGAELNYRWLPQGLAVSISAPRENLAR
ncbi:sensor histidine kinase [Sandarakinorhabdus sp. DWP1-3-1]|uniref:sensor histidine kinase n=1 Tax=Sandarakinorhabdus sp. DWP1-3-1 TaxID=2804627 RepID=UPI003CE9E779